MTIALVPAGTSIAQLEREGLAVGALSAGLGRVSATQTYLDISQGARVWSRLYSPRRVPVLAAGDGRITGWSGAVRRAAGAPADLVPGILGSAAGGTATAEAGKAAVIAADEQGRLSKGALFVRAARLTELGELRAKMRPRDLLIALERPPPVVGDTLLSVGAAGPGLRRGVLTSDSTRLDGLVLSTDLAPTALDASGVAVPDQVEGSSMRQGEGSVGTAIERLDRLVLIGDRRGPVLGALAFGWLLLTAVGAAFGRRGFTLAGRLIAPAAFLLPAFLLLGAALRPSLAIEAVVVTVGPLVAAALIGRVAPGRVGLGLAAGLTAACFAADLVAGSPLTSTSLLGPNPALGARFYGIGNELEAIFCVLVPVGLGTALSLRSSEADRRVRGGILLAGCLVAGLFLGAGRLGADVGAVIALTAAGAIGALFLAGVGRRSALAIALAAPVLGLAALAAIDLVSGGGAHLTRSVLDAGGLDGLADTAERRLRLSARSFARGSNLAFLALAVPLVSMALARRDELWRALGTPVFRAAYLGACGAVVIAALANDSGALLLLVGIAYLALTAWHTVSWDETRLRDRVI